MRLYIVEDDENLTRILKRIIIDCSLGNVVGDSTDGNHALSDIIALEPDIVLVDLFIPGLDGISLIRKLPKTINCIMISQVSSKDMIAKAYEAGAQFYMQKPINAVEVKHVIQRVISTITTNNKLSQIQAMFNEPLKAIKEQISPESKVEYILKQLGILSESGAEAIIQSSVYIMKYPDTLSDMTLKEFCSSFSNNPKSHEQKVRRTAAVALTNLAHLGIEDFSSTLFQDYAHALYSFKEVHQEMICIRDSKENHGKVNIKKFLEGIAHYASVANTEFSEY
ncbi:MAG: DNA-binding domain-containing protein [Acidaminobacteraceae bacterium]